MSLMKIFKDNYHSLPVGKIIKGELRDQTFGKWEQTSHHYSWKSRRLPNRFISTLPWRVVEKEGKRWLEQPEKWDNVVICSGNTDWRDYTFDVRIMPCSKARCGVLCRYQTSRQNYYIAFEGGKKVIIYRRNDDDLIPLTSVRFHYKVRNAYDMKIELTGERINIFIDRIPLISFCDTTFLRGKIGLRSDGPVRYGPLSVSMHKECKTAFNLLTHKHEQVLKEKNVVCPKPERITRIPIKVEFDYLHLHDFNCDGELEVLFIKQHCTGANKTRISYIGMTDMRGNTLWAHGSPKENLYPVHSDIAFNFGDIDGDGRTEIIITQDFEIKIVDASTGELKNKTETPGTEYEKHIIGDSFLLADLEGKGTKQNIILKDRYENIWAYDNKLNLLWQRRLNTGHFPRAADINGDGRDEIMAGYSMLSADGETLWTVPGADPLRNVWREPPHSEHADSIWIGRFSGEKDSPVQVAMAASDMGFLLLDANSGELIAQDKCGHAQSLAIGKFRKGLPGYQFAVCNLWGNPGIFTLLDCHGNRLACREIPPFEVIIPVNWYANGDACFIGVSTRRLFDSSLDVVCQFPKRKQPKAVVRPVADDFTGLGVDQLAFMNGHHLEIFKPETHGCMEMRHDTRNFNLYGAFFLEPVDIESD